MPGIQTIVFSHTLQEKDCTGVAVSNNPQQAISAIKTSLGKDIWLFGGGNLFHSLLDLRLVDSVEVAVISVLLGGGLPLLPQPSGHSKLYLVSHRVYPKTGTVSLEYVPAP